MLVNATQPEELRVAMVDGQKLYDLDIEVPSREQKKANIYKGKITRIEPSLEACFVDYGSERHGFLPLKEISRVYFKSGADLSGRLNIRDLLQEGQELVVQVDKEERGNKGAALTTFISLAGRFLVLMPNNPRAGGVSRRVEGDDRDELREALAALRMPDSMGIIIRTAGVGRSVEELQWDLDYLIQVWEAIEKASVGRPSPFLIYQESNVIIRALRDYLRTDVGEILVDEAKMFEEARHFMEQIMPQSLGKLKHYEDKVPLFTRYQIESQIEAAFGRDVRLPSGGAVVIDHTEAMVAIDVNSSRATKGSDIEETALRTNLEAADEVARQLRLRDLGGLIVIDFIDMSSQKNQRDVEDRLRDALKIDRARVQVGRLSRFGLLEMSRQRLRPSLGESTQVVCPRCNGEGHIRGIESLSLSVLRLIEEEAMKERTSRVVAQLPLDVATFLLNEKRPIISEVEKRCGVSVVLVPNPHMDSPRYDIQRLRDDELQQPGATTTSYKLVTEPAPAPLPGAVTKHEPPEEPAVKSITPAKPVPPSRVEVPHKPGIFTRLWCALFGSGEKPVASPPPRPTQREPEYRQDRDRGRDRSRHGQSGPRRHERDSHQQRYQGRNQPRQQERTQPYVQDRPQSRPQERQQPRPQERPQDRPQQSRPAPSIERTQPLAPVLQENSNTLPMNASQPQTPASENRPQERDKHQGNRSRSTRRGRRGGRRRRRYEGGKDSANRPAGAEENTTQKLSDTVPNFTATPPQQLSAPAPMLTKVETRAESVPPSQLMDAPRAETPRTEAPRVETPYVETPRIETSHVESPPVDKKREDPTIPLFRAREQGDTPIKNKSEFKPQTADTDSNSD
ncbi:MAG: Rne/Rng family ribonuclease [Gammaproteobacteria bacterium]|nr:Rne/Rng family ribonuclease [Gammaproteobacteria bacterium]